MKENDCSIRDCWCKCETKQEFKANCFDSIKKIIYDTRNKTKNIIGVGGYEDESEAFDKIGYIVDCYAEMTMGDRFSD